jgi:uncharacterized protein
MRDDGRLRRLWPDTAPIVGMVHLLPLPGAPGWGGSMAAVLERARADAQALADGGADGILVENYLDVPFHPGAVPPETVAAMSVAVAAIVAAVRVPVGVNVLRNDAAAALAIAAATGARFIRVNVHTGATLTDQGWIAGAAHDTLRHRARLCPEVAILADVLVKHAVAPAGLDVGQAASDAWHRGLADGLIVTGPATGAAADLDRLAAIRTAVPEAIVWVGSGIDAANVTATLAAADGVIVGSAISRDGGAGRGVDPARLRTLLAAAGRS